MWPGSIKGHPLVELVVWTSGLGLHPAKTSKPPMLRDAGTPLPDLGSQNVGTPQKKAGLTFDFRLNTSQKRVSPKKHP